MGLVKGIMEMKAQDIRQCVDMLLAEPTPDADEAQDMPSGRAGWVEGYKLWVGDLPDNICKKAIGHYCAGHVDVAVQRGKATSGVAYAIVTFTDLALASKAVEQLAMVRFDHGEGQRFWANVKWFAGHK